MICSLLLMLPIHCLLLSRFPPLGPRVFAFACQPPASQLQPGGLNGIAQFLKSSQIWQEKRD